MTPKLHAEALIFCLAWAALATLAFVRAGYLAGSVMSVGLLLLIMPASSLVLDRTGDLARERQVRWGLLSFSALGLAIWLSTSQN
ncbi:hypothetical protein [Sphingosinicella sp.]|uniref:hypothetical protein n=1 Tax=Sphingosinicella sp. TaxID=1917971 RepID=UPI004037A7CE